MEELGIAIHGAGWVAGEHIRAFSNNPNAQVRLISSRTKSGAEAKRLELGLECDVTDDYADVLARDDIDVVAICTPNHLHPEETIAAAEAGKHILIEKPVALNMTDLRSMREAVRKAGVKTVVSFVLRWGPYFENVKSLIEDGALGEITYAGTDYLHEISDWWSGYHWAIRKDSGGSTMLTGACHAVDALRWFVGDEVAEVTAYATRGNDQNFEYEPTIVAALQFENGAVGRVGGSFEFPMPYVFNVELYGTKGAIRNDKAFSSVKYPGTTEFFTIPAIMPDSGDVAHHPFQPEIDHFVDCIRSDVESHCNLEDAYKTHELVLAIDRSAEEHRSIKLPLDG